MIITKKALCTTHLITLTDLINKSDKIYYDPTLLEECKVKDQTMKRSITENLNDSKWEQRDTHNYLVRKQTLNYLAKTGQITELCCEYLSVRWIWLYIIMSRTRYRENLHSIIAWM